MDNELKSLNLRLFYLLRKISFQNERDRMEAKALQEAYDRLADRMYLELFDLFEKPDSFELLS